MFVVEAESVEAASLLAVSSLHAQPTKKQKRAWSGLWRCCRWCLSVRTTRYGGTVPPYSMNRRAQEERRRRRILRNCQRRTTTMSYIQVRITSTSVPRARYSTGETLVQVQCTLIWYCSRRYLVLIWSLREIDCRHHLTTNATQTHTVIYPSPPI